jgi:hypothetical protein
MRNLSLLTVLLIGVVTSVSFGTLITDPAQLLGNRILDLTTYGTAKSCAQSFTPTQNYIYRVELYIGTDTTETSLASLTIKGGNSDNVIPSTATTVLGSVENQLVPTAYGWVTFDFSDNPIDIRNYNSSAGTARLLLELKQTGTTAVKAYYGWYSTTYPGGIFYYSGDSPTNGDMTFKVWTDTVTQPTTLALFAVGSSLLMIKRRKNV